MTTTVTIYSKAPNRLKVFYKVVATNCIAPIFNDILSEILFLNNNFVVFEIYV